MSGPAAPERSTLAIERDAYRRGRTRRSFAVSFGATALLTVVAVLAVRRSPGWPRVHQSFFDWGVARSSFPLVLSGLWLNIRILLVAEVVVLVVGLALAVARTTRGPLLSRCGRWRPSTPTCSAGSRSSSRCSSSGSGCPP